MVKMRLTLQLCVAIAAVVGVVMAVEHVEQREVHNNRRDIVSPLVPEENRNYVRNRRLSFETRGRQRPRQNNYSGYNTQEIPDTSTTYLANQRLMGRYHAPGGRAGTRSLHTQGITVAQHESRTPQPMRINTGSVNNPSPVSRTRTTNDERFSSRVPQAGLQTSTNDRRRLPPPRDSHRTRVTPISMDRLQRPSSERNAEIHNRVSYEEVWATHTPSVARRDHQVYSGSLAASSTPAERHAHIQHRVLDTHSGLGSTSDPITAATITRGISTEQDTDAAGQRLQTQQGLSNRRGVLNNIVLQRLEQQDPCCGSRMPVPGAGARHTGAFERVAAAGSIKVVQVPTHNYPPNEVRDLQVTPLGLHTLSLTWTAPGENLDSGTASGYIIRLSEARHDLQESEFDTAPEDTLLDTSETLTAARVYQTAGTRVGVEVPLVRQLQRGHVYYVALKALDNDGYSSDVSNMARFLIPESSTTNSTAASHGTTITNQVGANPRVKEALSTSNSHGSIRRNEEMTVPSERNPRPPTTQASSTTSELETKLSSGGNNEQESLLSTSPTLTSDPSESEGSENQRKRGRKGRRRKQNKKSKRRGGRRNGRRNNRRREKNSNTLSQDLECDPTLPSEQEDREPVSLCDAQYSLDLVITYFVQNNEHQYLDYLSAALHTLEQKMQPPWRAEPRVRRSGRRRRMRTSIPERHP